MEQKDIFEEITEEVFADIAPSVKFEDTIPLYYDVLKITNGVLVQHSELIRRYEIKQFGLTAEKKAVERAELTGFCKVIEVCEGGIIHEIAIIAEPKNMTGSVLYKSGHKKKRVKSRY